VGCELDFSFGMSHKEVGRNEGKQIEPRIIGIRGIAEGKVETVVFPEGNDHRKNITHQNLSAISTTDGVQVLLENSRRVFVLLDKDHLGCAPTEALEPK
jgi:hypothetical protein